MTPKKIMSKSATKKFGMLTPSVNPVSHAPLEKDDLERAIIMPAKTPTTITRIIVTTPSLIVGTIDCLMMSVTLVPIFL